MNWLWTIVIGGIAGYLAALIMTGRGFGIAGDIIVGIVGALVGTLVFGTLNIALNFFWSALLGAIILLFVTGLVRRTEAV